jgi:cofilin
MVDANLDVAQVCTDAFNRLKLEKDVFYVSYKIENQTTVVVDHIQPKGVSYDNLAHHIPHNEPRFIVIDFDYTNNDGIVLSKIIFVHWCPDTARVQHKMVYASTKENLKKKFVGIFKEIQASAVNELTHESISSTIRL